MIPVSKYFELPELVCPHVYHKFGETAWQFFDDKLFAVIEVIRERLGRQMLVNNYLNTGKYDERGFRCIQCDLVKKAIAAKQLYVSPHMTGQAIDFDVKGMAAEEVRQWIIKNQILLPHPIRMEKDTSWVHLDTRDNRVDKIHLFNPLFNNLI
jgi:hypothetical protein